MSSTRGRQATVDVIAEWNPMVILDLHGFVIPMLIEPCTPPHNRAYDTDDTEKRAKARTMNGISEKLSERSVADGNGDAEKEH
ncbi:MAG: hypothetical protein JXA14_25020 [Anaerolineae bacterium]|nr:hypothetical protein [Anaerolineae bacterium]